MTQPQKGICAEPNLHALFLLFNVVDDDDQVIRVKLARILEVLNHFDEEHYEAMVSGVIAIGSSYWMEVYPGLIPQELAPFPDISYEDRNAPVLPCDLFIEIRADRVDICHAIAMEVMQLMRPHVELLEEVRAFRFLDGRDFLGFIQDSDNPKGMRKLDVAIVADNDPDFAGGSYVHIQRSLHKVEQWQLLSQSRQETIIGRQKTDGKVLEFALQEASSHLLRSHVKDDQGKKYELLKHSMPYGDMSVQGLFSVYCASSPKPFTKILHSRIIGDENGEYDKLLDYELAETGAAFFAPSITFIKAQAK